MFNSILIKRRPWWSPLGAGAPASLSGGELAFNDVDQTLYYGLSTETAGVSSLPIAGPGAFVSRTIAQDVSGSKTFKDDTTVDANLTVTGNLSVLGTQTVINTETINISGISTQIDVINNGTGTGITVNQTGSQDVAEFKDDGATALIIKDGGNVGIGTSTPNEKLTVAGNLSAQGDVFVDTVKITDNSGLGLAIYDNTDTQVAHVGNWFGESSFIGTSNNTNVYSGGTKLTLGSNSGGFPGTLGEALINSTQTNITGALSAQGALTVDGTATLNNDLTVIDYAVVKTSNWSAGMAGGGIEIDPVNNRINVDDGSNSYNTWYTANSIYSQISPTGFTISTVADAGAGIKFTPANGSHTNVTQGNFRGNGSNYVEDFIIDGGTF